MKEELDKESKQALIKYRLERSSDSLKEAQLMEK